jgi:hypothetical protein
MYVCVCVCVCVWGGGVIKNVDDKEGHTPVPCPTRQLFDVAVHSDCILSALPIRTNSVFVSLNISKTVADCRYVLSL